MNAIAACSVLDTAEEGAAVNGMNGARIKIAVAPRVMVGNDNAHGALRESTTAMSVALSDAIGNAGASAWLLPRMNRDPSVEFLDDIVASHDGLVLQGGPDIAPELYGGAIKETGVHDPDADRREIALLHHFIRAGKPVLGLCRGCQLINVAFGGTLYGDLSTERASGPLHSDPSRYVGLEHRIELRAGGFLHALYGVDRGVVNSAHHQGVLQLAEILEIEATTTDGLVEAFRGRGSSYILGLQWHPEFHAQDSHLLSRAALFDDFVREAARVRSTRNVCGAIQ